MSILAWSPSSPEPLVPGDALGQRYYARIQVDLYAYIDEVAEDFDGELNVPKKAQYRACIVGPASVNLDWQAPEPCESFELAEAALVAELVERSLMQG